MPKDTASWNARLPLAYGRLHYSDQRRIRARRPRLHGRVPRSEHTPGAMPCRRLHVNMAGLEPFELGIFPNELSKSLHDCAACHCLDSQTPSAATPNGSPVPKRMLLHGHVPVLMPKGVYTRKRMLLQERPPCRDGRLYNGKRRTSSRCTARPWVYAWSPRLALG